jgi:CubicO group peptidase (beta-lactamase class C family)
MKTRILIFLCLISLLPLHSQITSHEIDSVAELALKIFDVPGMAVAVVKDGKVIHSKGYGVRSIRTNLPVDENTLFGVASNTKAFTAAALGILVDEKKLRWDDNVIDYIPEFVLYDPYVTREFTIRDLLTHRSGLGLGAGDLMIWPDNSRPLSEIIHNLRYLKPVSSFRSKYDYDNLMYLVAGEVIARVSGMSYEDFIEKKIMNPLGMKTSSISFDRVINQTNLIDPHVPVDGKITVAERTPWTVSAAAGGIYSNLTDMSKWIVMQMNRGRYGQDLKQRLFSEKVHRDMWSPVTVQQLGDSTDYNTHFAAYGLGWGLSDVKGYLKVGHSGGLMGMVTLVTMIPEIKLGILVFTNQQSGASMRAVTGFILDRYLGVKGTDRIRQYSLSEQRNFNIAKNVTASIWKEIESVQKAGTVKIDNKSYAGTYADSWFGNVSIIEKNGALWFASEKSPKLSGEMFHYRANTFIVKWTDRTLDADAFAMFTLDKKGNAVEFRMSAISPLTDFSFDFQDLEFKRK